MNANRLIKPQDLPPPGATPSAGNFPVPTGEYRDFVIGFVVSESAVWGRPVGVTVARDGALPVSEDGNGTIWLITH
jgi:hypothetical protein